MLGRLSLAFSLALLAPSPAAARTVVTSSAPDRVAITVYRDPGRPPEQQPDLTWLDGFALISETRWIQLPAGESEIRFEGVAGGILPQSAIVTGLPEGIVERNRDAYLLSPGTLIDRSIGRRVHLRRTSLATGEVREHEAVIRSGADGAVVLQTAEGFEALRCTGLAETLVYDQVPQGLSARPTLSVRTRSGRPATAAVTLSYLASGFDWQANYIAALSPAGDRIDLFAWLTLANGDETGFADADTQAVAGRLNREYAERGTGESRPLNLRCWPRQTTSGFPFIIDEEQYALTSVATSETLIVTGSRIVRPDLTSSSPVTVIMAEQEELGYLKLYRIPEPVTVAANSQKQVALLERQGVSVEIVYRLRLGPGELDQPLAPERFLVTRNREAEGLGLPLPAGGLVLFAAAGDRPILVGEGFVRDSAVGEDVEIMLGEAVGVEARIAFVRESRNWREYLLTVSNDQAAPIRFEGEFRVDQERRFRPASRLARRDGRPLWRVTVPANGTASLRYRVRSGDWEAGRSTGRGR